MKGVRLNLSVQDFAVRGFVALVLVLYSTSAWTKVPEEIVEACIFKYWDEFELETTKLHGNWDPCAEGGAYGVGFCDMARKNVLQRHLDAETRNASQVIKEPHGTNRDDLRFFVSTYQEWQNTLEKECTQEVAPQGVKSSWDSTDVTACEVRRICERLLKLQELLEIPSPPINPDSGTRRSAP